MPTKTSVLLSLILTVLIISATGCSVFDTLSKPTEQVALDTPTVEPAPTLPQEEEMPTEAINQPTATEVDTCSILDSGLQEEMVELQDQVVTLRGLQATSAVDKILLTREELVQRLIELFQSDYSEEEALTDTRVLALLGLLSPDFDLWNFYIDLYGEQIAGFYDDTTKELTIICGAAFGGPERDVYVHEYTHALQDQTYDLENGLGMDDESCEADSERCYALQALIEGDATLLEMQWWQIYATEQDWADLINMANTLETPILDSAPKFVRDDLLFPYLAGRRFVETLYLDGGWAAVDRAYLDPPLSTEQILHPEKYPSDPPIWLTIPDLGDTLGEAWYEIDRTMLGEWTIQMVLNEHLPKSDAVQAAEGWGGDFSLVFHNDEVDKGILIFVAQWDKMRDVIEFADAFLDYADTRFGQRATSTTYQATWDTAGSYVLFERISNQTLWLLTPDKETAELLRQALSFPVRQQ